MDDMKSAAACISPSVGFKMENDWTGKQSDQTGTLLGPAWQSYCC